MEHDEIRRLARLMEELGLAELEVEDEASRVRLVRAGTTAASRGTPEESRRAAATDAPDGSGEDTDSIPSGLVAVRSPLVGTFWRAPSPDAAPFVSPGDAVDAGAVLCLVEAMKTMNEVVAEARSRVVSVRPGNGAAIEYGTILFLVEPLG